MNNPLFIATANTHKIKEIQEIIGGEGLLMSLNDLPYSIPEVEETEATLEGNAILKAKSFYAYVQMPCLADDTGLEVVALQGRPGVYSARYAGVECSAHDNIQKLLGELDGISDRKARFRTVMAYYDGTDIQLFTGEVEGSILQAPQGNGGFGYDPIFLPKGYDRSFAELSPQEKHAVSHRAKAVNAFAAYLSSLS